MLRAYDKHRAQIRIGLFDGDPTHHVSAIRQSRLDLVIRYLSIEFGDKHHHLDPV
ncbi:hypothetical protein [Terribium terrae]|uniref:hypothetical protein n=1 Tax=Terribium terrae TaxID=2725666 RepID=UPI003758489D